MGLTTVQRDCAACDVHVIVITCTLNIPSTTLIRQSSNLQTPAQNDTFSYGFNTNSVLLSWLSYHALYSWLNL